MLQNKMLSSLLLVSACLQGNLHKTARVVLLKGSPASLITVMAASHTSHRTQTPQQGMQASLPQLTTTISTIASHPQLPEFPRLPRAALASCATPSPWRTHPSMQGRICSTRFFYPESSTMPPPESPPNCPPNYALPTPSLLSAPAILSHTCITDFIAPSCN